MGLVAAVYVNCTSFQFGDKCFHCEIVMDIYESENMYVTV